MFTKKALFCSPGMVAKICLNFRGEFGLVIDYKIPNLRKRDQKMRAHTTSLLMQLHKFVSSVLFYSATEMADCKSLRF